MRNGGYVASGVEKPPAKKNTVAIKWLIIAKHTVKLRVEKLVKFFLKRFLY